MILWFKLSFEITVCFLPPGGILADIGLISLRMIHVVQKMFSTLLCMAKCIEIYNVYILFSFILFNLSPGLLRKESDKDIVSNLF